MSGPQRQRGRRISVTNSTSSRGRGSRIRASSSTTLPENTVFDNRSGTSLSGNYFYPGLLLPQGQQNMSHVPEVETNQLTAQSLPNESLLGGRNAERYLMVTQHSMMNFDHSTLLSPPMQRSEYPVPRQAIESQLDFSNQVPSVTNLVQDNRQSLPQMFQDQGMGTHHSVIHSSSPQMSNDIQNFAHSEMHPFQLPLQRVQEPPAYHPNQLTSNFINQAYPYSKNSVGVYDPSIYNNRFPPQQHQIMERNSGNYSELSFNGNQRQQFPFPVNFNNHPNNFSSYPTSPEGIIERQPQTHAGNSCDCYNRLNRRQMSVIVPNNNHYYQTSVLPPSPAINGLQQPGFDGRIRTSRPLISPPQKQLERMRLTSSPNNADPVFPIPDTSNCNLQSTQKNNGHQEKSLSILKKRAVNRTSVVSIKKQHSPSDYSRLLSNGTASLVDANSSSTSLSALPSTLLGKRKLPHSSLPSFPENSYPNQLNQYSNPKTTSSPGSSFPDQSFYVNLSNDQALQSFSDLTNSASLPIRKGDLPPISSFSNSKWMKKDMSQNFRAAENSPLPNFEGNNVPVEQLQLKTPANFVSNSVADITSNHGAMITSQHSAATIVQHSITSTSQVAFEQISFNNINTDTSSAPGETFPQNNSTSTSDDSVEFISAIDNSSSLNKAETNAATNNSEDVMKLDLCPSSSSSGDLIICDLDERYYDFMSEPFDRNEFN